MSTDRTATEARRLSTVSNLANLFWTLQMGHVLFGLDVNIQSHCGHSEAHSSRIHVHVNIYLRLLNATGNSNTTFILHCPLYSEQPIIMEISVKKRTSMAVSFELPFSNIIKACPKDHV